MFFLGEKRLAKIPDEHDVYMLAMLTGWKPQDIREMGDDAYWMAVYYKAHAAAMKEIKRRGDDN